MQTRTCKTCNIEKPFAKGSWVVSRGYPIGNVCLACSSKRVVAWAKENKAKVNARNTRWQSNNLAQHAAHSRKSQAKLAKRMPAWLTEEDLDTIKHFYDLAKVMEANTGIKYHVDHIIPLTGKMVSGLHVPTNLQILSASQNSSKGNKHG